MYVNLIDFEFKEYNQKWSNLIEITYKWFTNIDFEQSWLCFFCYHLIICDWNYYIFFYLCLSGPTRVEGCASGPNHIHEIQISYKINNFKKKESHIS